MPREARKKYENHLFHIMTQGINKEKIFNLDKYKKLYIKLLFEHANKKNIKIVSYCIMGNHAHILINTEKIDDMSEFMKIINMKFAMIYNNSENRVGVVFRNRFTSEIISDESYFYNCVTYIHNNPVKAGLVECAKDYRFSSANNFNLNKALNEIKSKVNGIAENSNFIDTDEDKKIVKREQIQRIINNFKENHNLEKINLRDKKLLEELICIIKTSSNANNCEIAELLRDNKGNSIKLFKKRRSVP